jgi:hypothetical protein
MGWVVNAQPRPLYPRGRDAVQLLSEAGRSPEPGWTGTKKLFPPPPHPTPDIPARSELLYRLSYPGP